MKKFILISALFLAGCATSPNAGGVKQVQDAAVQLCRFLPAFQTVSDILLSGNSIAMSTGAVAKAICDAVTINPLADGPGAKNYKPTVAGVRVRGQFVK